MLVADVAHELFEQVLERDDAPESTRTIAHDGQVTPTAQHLEEEVVAPRRHGCLGNRAQPNVLSVGVLEHVERVDHPDDVVEGVAIDGDAAVARLRNSQRTVRAANALIEREHVRSWRHDLAERLVPELDHPAYDRQFGPFSD